ncbi:JmjC domain-containing protein [Streptomyces echinatus]|uniref:JmjC domain-containing protein n=1 Tax=Streptomyces echinatus TaxID=67293 RepID=UPI0037F206EE
MTTTSIAACLGGDFLIQALHREHRHFPAAVDAAGLMAWDDLNKLLATQRPEPPRMRLHQGGPPLHVGDYTEPVTTRRHTVWRRLQPAELHAHLADGASLVLDCVDKMHRPLVRLVEDMERTLRTRVQANLHASWTAAEGFGVHWDDHDTIVVQLDGSKHWLLLAEQLDAADRPLHQGHGRPGLRAHDVEPGERLLTGGGANPCPERGAQRSPVPCPVASQGTTRFLVRDRDDLGLGQLVVLADHALDDLTDLQLAYLAH